MATLADLKKAQGHKQGTEGQAIASKLKSMRNKSSGLSLGANLWLRNSEEVLDVADRGIRQMGTGARLGMAPTIDAPQNVYEAGMRMAGETLPFAVALPLAIANKIKTPASIAAEMWVESGFVGKISQGIRAVGDDAMRFLRDKPYMYVTAELTAGAGAGIGGHKAVEAFPDSESARMIGELTGGGIAASTIPISVAAYRMSGHILSNLPIIRTFFTPKEVRARKRILRATPDPEAAVAAGEVPLLEGLTPAQKTGDRGLLAMEKAVLDSTDELARVSDDQIFDMNEIIKESLSEVGGKINFEDTRQIFEAAKDHLTSLLDTRLKIAALKAQERINKLKPGATREQHNLIARQEIEKALADANIQEKDLYNLVPEEISVPTISSRRSLQSYISGENKLGKAQQSDIPAIAKKYLKPKYNEAGKQINPDYVGDNATILDLRSVQSKLREKGRISRSQGKYNSARIADDIANSITEDFARANSDDGDVQAIIDAAVSFSRTKNNRFNKGVVGDVLSSKATGADAVPANLTLEVGLYGSGPKQKEAYEQLLRAVGDDPEIFSGAVEDYIKDDFLRKAFPGDTLNIASAERYLNSNQDILAAFPGLRKDMRAAIDAQDVASLMTRRNKSIGARLSNPRVSKAALILKEHPDKLFDRIESSRFPSREAKKVINRAKKDETGEALKGLKTAYVDRLMRKSIITKDEIGYVSGHKMDGAMHAPLIKELFSPGEIERLDIIVATAKRMDLARRAKPAKEGVMGDVAGQLAEFLSQIGAAQAGRVVAKKTGGGTVQTPGIFVKRARDWLGKHVADPGTRMITDAVQDEQLFKALLLDEAHATPKQLGQARRRINAWLAVVAGDIGPEKEEE